MSQGRGVRGYLYIISPQPMPEVFKLGRSDQHPYKRLSDLQIAHWWPLELVHHWPGSSSEEAALHRLLMPAHVRGEWFSTPLAVRQARELPPGVARALIGLVGIAPRLEVAP